ncbi:uncharacterized protein LOC112201518 isoform X2 [Rosa chinensis]|uniref:uncharacterized protein LOC112201518 isoform X2 n=1 Tax=Rosa chinensis TaxID=74649 RepID=UPI001AD8A12E|nr:uncharacterized protein LOC112201518 isoform X2 [Rosa chinensis]
MARLRAFSSSTWEDKGSCLWSLKRVIQICVASNPSLAATSGIVKPWNSPYAKMGFLRYLSMLKRLATGYKNKWLIFSCGGIRSYQEVDNCTRFSFVSLARLIPAYTESISNSALQKRNKSPPKSKPFFLLAGPNVIESEEHIFRMAKHIKTIATNNLLLKRVKFPNCDCYSLSLCSTRRVGQSLVAKTGALSAKSYSLKTRLAVW